jgi:hypothetical protein
LVDFSLIPKSALKVRAWLPDGRGNSVGVLAMGRTGRTTRVGLMMGSWSLFETAGTSAFGAFETLAPPRENAC